MSHPTPLRVSFLLAASLAACTSRSVVAPPSPASASNSGAAAQRHAATALDRYVAAPDPSYAWTLAGSKRGDGVTVHALDMTSQTWLTADEVDRTAWRHWILVIEPDGVARSTALLYIGGGENGEAAPPKPKKELVAIARATRSIVAELRMVPNQPLVFAKDGVARDEDDLVAYTWAKFLASGDERWPARLPMTKAAVRAMDAITAFCASEAKAEGAASGDDRGPASTASAASAHERSQASAAALAKVDRFVVAGMSKRGWTTWTTAAVDPRVVAIAPMVIDVLNVEPSMLNHFQAYGFWAPAVASYVAHGVMDRLGTSEMKALLAIEDPFAYRARLTMPKLVLNSSGDQFFTPDSSRHYFDALPGPKYLRYVPNCDHSLKKTDAFETLAAWHHAILDATPLPRFTWSHDDEGTIRVRATDRPRSATLWRAHAATARDFRLETLGPAWTATELAIGDNGEIVARAAPSTSGWTASFVELAFDVGAPAPLKLTTDVVVRPDTLPFSRPAGARESASARR